MALSVLTAVCVSSFAVAGGDMKDVEPAVVPVIPMAEEEKNGFYAGLGVSAVSTRDGSLSFFDAESGQDRTGNLLGLVGYEFNPYVAVEGRYSTYIAEEDFLNSDTWGVYLKPQYPVNEDFKVYGLVGFGGIDADGVNGADVDVDDSGFQWGLGASYVMTETFSVFFDYVSLASDMESDAFLGNTPDVDSDALTLGVIYNF